MGPQNVGNIMANARGMVETISITPGVTGKSVLGDPLGIDIDNGRIILRKLRS